MEPIPTRERVLEAATKVFLEHGFTAASMDQVRQEAGVSNGSLYHHFPTKARLADALYAYTLRDFHATLLAAIGPRVTAEAGVKGLIRAYLQWVLQHPDRARLLHKLRRTGDLTDTASERNQANEATFGTLGEWVRRKTEAGELRELPFPVWLALVFSPALSLTQQWVRKPGASVASKVRAALEHAAWMSVAA